MQAGQIIAGRYRVEEFLGKGATADVYRVWDGIRSARLAIKVLNAALSADTTFIDDFRAEAEILSRLQHPNIVRFYSLERSAGQAFIVMEYVAGQTLRDEIRGCRGPMQPDRIQQILRDVCSALNYAHELGYVHCDIKPANIMINEAGSALVTDFGIARLARTGTQSQGGTPAYMAPEQIRGEIPTRAVDIYALGVVLFEMLTGGRRPFTGDSAQLSGSAADRIRWEQTHLAPPSPRQYNPAISPALEAVVLRCLEMEPAQRFSNDWDFMAALANALQTVQPRDQGFHEIPRDGAMRLVWSKGASPVTVAQRRAGSRGARVFLIVTIPVAMLAAIFLVSGAATPSQPMPRPTIGKLHTPISFPTPTPVWLSYSSSMFSFDIQYPPGWVYQEDSSKKAIVFGTSNDLLAGEALPSHGAALAITRARVTDAFPDAATPYSPTTLLDLLMSKQFQSIHQVQAVQTRYINSLPAAIGAYGASDQTGIHALLDVTVVVDDDNFVLLLGVVPDTEWQTYHPMLERMRNSLKLGPYVP